MVEVTAAAKGASPPDPTKTSGSAAISAPFRISTVQNRDRYFKGLFYGRHGAGKTELAASAVDVPFMQDVLMIDAESGDMTLYDSTRIVHSDRIHHIKVSDFRTVAVIQEFLQAYCAARDRGDKATMARLYAQVTGIQTQDPPSYRTVIIDSLTEVEAYCTYQVLKVDINNIQKELNSDIDVAGWPEFRKNNEMMKLLVRAFRDLPMHVIFVCAESYVQDERKVQHYSPALTGKLTSQVQGFVDMVGRVIVGEPNPDTGIAPRRVMVQPISGTGGKFDAKNRRSVFQKPFFENPTMSDIMRETGLIPKE